MRFEYLKEIRKSGLGLSAPWLMIPGSFLLFALLSSEAHANPLTFQNAIIFRNAWIFIPVGIVIESLILRIFVSYPMKRILNAVILAGMVSGFIGYISLLIYRQYSIPILPPLPTAFAATIVETIIIAGLLYPVPVKRLMPGIALANLVIAALTIILLVPREIQPSPPGVPEDLLLSQSIAKIRSAIEIYKSESGSYPDFLAGGDFENTGIHDPLLSGGFLDAYPENPYSLNLHNRKFSISYMLSGILPATFSTADENPEPVYETRYVPGSGSGELVPGSFFYKSYDLNRDGIREGYVLGGIGWPGSIGVEFMDLIDASSGEVHLRMESGQVFPGEPDGFLEPVIGVCTRSSY